MAAGFDLDVGTAVTLFAPIEGEHPMGLDEM